MGKLSYPFYRNRYYNGKLLQAEDFIREQEYFNGKLAFTNACVFGHGIIEGMRIQKVDGEAVLLEAGCCIDGNGRMIVVDHPAIRKLGTLEGFHQIEGGFSLLKLYYKQEASGNVYCAIGTEEEKTEYSTVKESYELRLEPPEAEEPLDETEFLSKSLLFCDEELRITQLIPRVLWGSGTTQLLLRVENFTVDELDVELSYHLDTPGFYTDMTEKPPELQNAIFHFRKGTTELPYSLIRREGVFAQSTIFTFSKEQVSLVKHGKRFYAPKDFREEFSVEAENPRQSLLRRLRALPLESVWNSAKDGVVLAALHFIRMERKSILDEVILPGPEGYAYHPVLFQRAERYASFYGGLPERRRPLPDDGKQDNESAEGTAVNRLSAVQREHFFRSGLIRMETGLNYKPGTILYSEEIIHGLGPGMIYVDFGLEDQYVDQQRTRNKSEIILGENTLFEQMNGEITASLEKAVKIFPDKGTFILAIRSEKRISQPILNLRWYACRTEESAVADKPAKGGRLRGLEPDVASLEPKESVSFIPVFQEGESEPCDFFLGPGEKGYVSKNGVYTAPDEEGLFVVTASVHGRPNERASAFVIVRRTGGGTS